MFLCGRGHIEDIITYLGHELKLRSNTSVASSDTICRVLKSLAYENTKCTSERGAIYEHTAADRMNNLLLYTLMVAFTIMTALIGAIINESRVSGFCCGIEGWHAGLT